MAARIRNTAKSKPKEGFCVYLGPSIRGIVNYGKIFEGSVQDAKREIWDGIVKYPRIENLIIDGDYLPEARVKVKTPGNALHAQYMELVRELSK